MAAKEPDGKQMEACKSKLRHLPSHEFFLPQQRDAAVGIQPDAFRRHDERTPKQYQQFFFLDPSRDAAQNKQTI